MQQIISHNMIRHHYRMSAKASWLRLDDHTPVKVSKHDLTAVCIVENSTVHFSPQCSTAQTIVQIVFVSSYQLLLKKNSRKAFCIAFIVFWILNNLCSFVQWRGSENHCIWAAISKTK